MSTPVPALHASVGPGPGLSYSQEPRYWPWSPVGWTVTFMPLHTPSPLDITFLSPIFQILLGFCYHTMVYFDIIESALTPAFTWSKVPRPRRPTIPLTGDKAPPAWTGQNLINHVPPKGPISYLFIYLFNQNIYILLTWVLF